MILADKIIDLRKKNGWSQEELAEKVNVTRQSVSKWEGAQSVPDLDKILQLAQVFGVSTDYLLKDDLEQAEYVTTVEEVTDIRRVSLEEANEFIRVKKITSKRIAFATVLCILSPVTLFMLGAASEIESYGISENLAGGVGMIVLLLMVAIAVAIFVTSGMLTSPYEYLEKEVFETEYGVSGMVKERQKQYKDTYSKYTVLGICLCILSVVPLIAGAFISENELFLVGMLSLLLVIVSVGVFMLITVGIKWESMQKLLQEGDYTKQKKQKHAGDVIGPVYWPVVIAIYLGWSFMTNNWEYTWVVWPIAVLIFAAISNLVEAFRKNKE